MKTYQIQDVFTINGKGTVLTCSITELSETTRDKEKADEELTAIMNIGDKIIIEENQEAITIQGIERFGKLMYPVIYGRNVGILIRSIQEEKNWYPGKTIQVIPRR